MPAAQANGSQKFWLDGGPFAGAPSSLSTKERKFYVNGAPLLEYDPSDGILPTGIASTLAFGTFTIYSGAILATGLASTVAFGTAIVIGPILPTGIASTLGIGTPAIPLYVTGIASTLAFGNPTVQSEISLEATGIGSTVAFGAPLILLDTDRAFTIFIGGVDRTKYVRDPSIEITHQLGSRGACSFRMIREIRAGEVISAYDPAMYDEVIVYHLESGYRLFAGEIEAIGKTLPSGSSDKYELDIRATDYGVILDRRAMAKWYTVFLGSYVAIIARDIVDRFLDGTGITYSGTGPAGSYIGEQLCNWQYVGDFLRQICDEGGLTFRVTPFKELVFIDRATGYEAAPFSIVQDDGNWRSLTSTQTRGKFANRVIVRNSQDITALWTDTTELDGSLSYSTTYPLSVKPVVLVDDAEQIVAAINDLGATAGATFYYIPDGIGLFATSIAPVSGTLEIIYPSRTSAVTIAEDAASIALNGQWDHIEEVRDITDRDALQQHAESVLAQLGTIPEVLDIETDRAGLEPGQLLTVAANNVAGDYLIEQIDISEIYNSYPRWRVRASNAPQRNGAGSDFFRKLLVRAQRQAVDRVDSHIAFVLAETVEGAENPGLTTGVKNAVRIARKSGYAKIARLFFQSVNASPSVLTTETIEIDMLQNGVSIFGGSYKMLFPAGATTVQTNFLFSQQPLRVTEGDVFTVQVIRADSLATDGFFELQVQG
jgi:hypothetical protein